MSNGLKVMQGGNKQHQRTTNSLTHMELPNRPAVVSYADIADLILDTCHVVLTY